MTFSMEILPKFIYFLTLSQPVFTCSKLTIEALEQRCEICSKLTIKTPKRHQWRHFGVFIVNFENISHLCSSFAMVNFEYVITGWDDANLDPCLKRINLSAKYQKLTLDPFHATVHFLYPMKTSENLLFFYVFRGYKK